MLFADNVGFGDNIWVEPIVRHFLAQGEEVLLQLSHPCIFDHYPSQKLFVNCPERLFPLQGWPIRLKFQEKPKMHYLDAFCQQAGIAKMKKSYPRLYLSRAEKQRKVPHRYAVLHLDKYKPVNQFRNVFGVEWREVVCYLRARGIESLQIAKYGKDLVAEWMPTRDFRDIMSLIYHSELFIGLDSGPSHIAAVMNIPAVLFFGSVNPLFRHLDRKGKVFLQNPCPFAHCYHEVPNTFGQPCRRVAEGEPPPCCIQNTERVIEAIASLL